MPVEGVRGFIILFLMFPAVGGFIAEFLLCLTKNAKIKLVIPVLGLAVYLIRGIITKDFIGGFFGPITLGAFIMLIIDYLWSNRKEK